MKPHKVYFAAVTLMTCSFAEPLSADESDLRYELRTKWAAQAAEIKTARIKYRRFSPGSNVIRDMPRAELLAIVSDTQSSDTSEFRKLIDRLTEKKLADNPWGRIELITAGKNIRELHRDRNTTHILTADKEVIIDGLGPPRVFQPNKSRVALTGLRDMRSVPTEEAALRCRIVARANGKATVRVSEISEFVVDEATARIERHTTTLQGGVHRDILQLHPKKFDGDILFPTMVVDADYRDGLVHSLTITLVEEAIFNEEIPAKLFEVAVMPRDDGPPEPAPRWVPETPNALPRQFHERSDEFLADLKVGQPADYTEPGKLVVISGVEETNVLPYRISKIAPDFIEFKAEGVRVRLRRSAITAIYTYDDPDAAKPAVKKGSG